MFNSLIKLNQVMVIYELENNADELAGLYTDLATAIQNAKAFATIENQDYWIFTYEGEKRLDYVPHSVIHIKP